MNAPVPWILRLAALAAFVIALVVPAGTAQIGGLPPAEPPRLLVLIVVDQFATEYIPLYGHQWTKGLRRLLDRGAYFPLSAYTYATARTCPGHVTIATGTWPATHGLIDNSWYERGDARTVACMDDATVSPVAFGGLTGKEQHGPARMRLRTLGEELRQQQAAGSRTVTLSLKPRSAIGLAGRPSPDTITLWQEEDGTWATSTAYATTPWPDIDAFVHARPIGRAYGQAWTRALPDSAYLFTDTAPGEPAGAVFPHVLRSASGTPDAAFAARWRRSPLSDAFLTDLAITLVASRQLGQRGVTDLLGVGYTALDLVGHDYGPRSHEVQDILVGVDESIGRLLDALDRAVGPDRYTVALTADHGIPMLPEQAALLGLSAGRVSTTAVRVAVERTLTGLFGEGAHVSAVVTPYLYFAPGVVDWILATPGAREAVRHAVLATEGVGQAYWADEVEGPWRPSEDPLLAMIRRSYFAGRSGDLTFVLRPFWIPGSTGTTHGTPHDYDVRVPIILAGASIRPGRYASAAHPADIAPTLAAIVGVTMREAEGRVLTEALVR